MEEEFGIVTDFILSRQNRAVNSLDVLFVHSLGRTSWGRHGQNHNPGGVIYLCAQVFLEALRSPLEAGVSVAFYLFITHLNVLIL